MPPSKRAARKPAKKAAAKTRRGKAATAGKADGDAPVRSFIASLDGWQRDRIERLDAMIAQEVPGVRRAMKWGVPFYGVEDRGWFGSLGVFKHHVKLTFLRGTELKPPPPEGTAELMRSLDIREGDKLDEKRIASWIRQAAALPGWAK